MPPIIKGPPDPGAPARPLWHRLAWFFGLALAAGGATALIAYGLRVLLPA